MDITVHFDDYYLTVRPIQLITIWELKQHFYDVCGVPVADQRLYEQGGQDELGDDICIQDLVNILNRGLWMQLRNPGGYMVELILKLPDGRKLNRLFRRIKQVDWVRHVCSLATRTNIRNITLRVGRNRVLGDDEPLFQFANGTVITCVVHRSVEFNVAITCNEISF